MLLSAPHVACTSFKSSERTTRSLIYRLLTKNGWKTRMHASPATRSCTYSSAELLQQVGRAGRKLKTLESRPNPQHNFLGCRPSRCSRHFTDVIPSSRNPQNRSVQWTYNQPSTCLGLHANEHLFLHASRASSFYPELKPSLKVTLSLATMASRLQDFGPAGCKTEKHLKLAVLCCATRVQSG